MIVVIPANYFTAEIAEDAKKCIFCHRWKSDEHG